MTAEEIRRVQEYLRKQFGNPRIAVVPPAKPGGPVEVSVDGEFIGVLYRDEDEGEVSYALQISILAEDLDAA